MYDPDKSVFIIAEAGVNHNGDPDLAMELIDAAARSGADAVKFQTFDPSLLTTKTARKARYQQLASNEQESQQEMLSRLHFDHSIYYELRDRAEDREIMFMSSAFDAPSLEFLVSGLGLPVLKIASGELTNGPLLLEFARAGRSIVLSTGMSTSNEVEVALSILAFGLLGGQSYSPSAFREAFSSEVGKDILRRKVALLHCTTQYPAQYFSANLNAIDSLKHNFGLKVGYSDHTAGTMIAVAAVAKGARVIEKHLTLDKNLPGPDHQASLECPEFQRMVEDIRLIEEALGDGVKEPHESELDNMRVARKSLVASRNITSGEMFTPENVTVKRPGTGRSPMDYWDIMGQKATKDYVCDELL